MFWSVNNHNILKVLVYLSWYTVRLILRFCLWFWMFSFKLFWNIPWYSQVYIIIYKETVLISATFCVKNLFRVMFVPNISYFIITIWNFRSINNVSVFSGDMIIFLFLKDLNVPPNHCFNESFQSFTFTERLFIFPFINKLNYFTHLVIITHKRIVRHVLHNMLGIIQQIHIIIFQSSNSLMFFPWFFFNHQ